MARLSVRLAWPGRGFFLSELSQYVVAQAGGSFGRLASAVDALLTPIAPIARTAFRGVVAAASFVFSAINTIVTPIASVLIRHWNRWADRLATRGRSRGWRAQAALSDTGAGSRSQSMARQAFADFVASVRRRLQRFAGNS